MRRPDPTAPVVALLILVALVPGAALTASAASPSNGASATATATPCPRSLKFAGSLYLDSDARVSRDEVGPALGETEPNPAQCALPDRLTVYRHNGRNSTDEVVYYVDPNTPEVFRSAGQTGLPGGNLVRWLVFALVAAIILFAAIPAILGHLREPPIAVGDEEAGPDRPD